MSYRSLKLGQNYQVNSNADFQIRKKTRLVKNAVPKRKKKK